MNEDIYTFGICTVCKENRALKNGVCPGCEGKQPELPDYFKDLFGNIFGGDKKWG